MFDQTFPGADGSARRFGAWSVMSATDQIRPFNQPTTVLGKLVFGFLGWAERRIAANSRVGMPAIFENSTFDWVPEVEAGWAAVRDEARAVLPYIDQLPNFQDISEEVAYINRDDQWKTFMLMGYGLRMEENIRQCPATEALLRKIPGVRTAFFSILAPGKRIPEHRGPYNGVLRLHLGLIVPEPAERCWIKVDGQQAHWQEGKALLFDDAYRHEVHNDTDGVRVVLFVDFLRPCRWPVNWLNALIVYGASLSPMLQAAKRNHERWSKRFYRERDKR
jgi:beta-hydroxylase